MTNNLAAQQICRIVREEMHEREMSAPADETIAFAADVT
jgi:hypothetical protein